jgi:hypothetical protein
MPPLKKEFSTLKRVFLCIGVVGSKLAAINSKKNGNFLIRQRGIFLSCHSCSP